MLIANCTKNSGETSSQAENKATPAVSVSDSTWELVIEGLNFPEGPAWDGESTLYLSNCYGGWITRLANDRADTFLTASDFPFTFAKTNGMAFYDGHLFACDFGRGAILKISPKGKTEIYASRYEGKAFNRPNDLVFDVRGNLYFTDPHRYSRTDRDGRIFRIAAQNRRIELAADSLAFPNGIAFSADGRKLYVCESACERILRFEVQPEGGLANKEVFVELPGGDPDGIALDEQGNLYVAHFGGGAVYVISPEGDIRQRIAAPGEKPTNLEFGGEDLKTLYLTEVETNALYKLRN